LPQVVLSSLFIEVRAFRHWGGTGKRVQIPRCRATVSELMTKGHCANGKASAVVRDARIATREPGDRREPSTKPLSRAKEDCLVRCGFLLSLLILTAAAVSAEQLKLKVISPDQQAVTNARVLVYNGERMIASGTTEGNGEAQFKVPNGSYNVQVLVPGFARASEHMTVNGDVESTVQLHIAGPSETVQVTAAGTPIETAQSGADVSTVTTDVLENQQPIALSDTLRSLPGAVLSASGQRGALTALFVR